MVFTVWPRPAATASPQILLETRCSQCTPRPTKSKTGGRPGNLHCNTPCGWFWPTVGPKEYGPAVLLRAWTSPDDGVDHCATRGKQRAVEQSRLGRKGNTHQAPAKDAPGQVQTQLRGRWSPGYSLNCSRTQGQTGDTGCGWTRGSRGWGVEGNQLIKAQQWLKDALDPSQTCQTFSLRNHVRRLLSPTAELAFLILKLADNISAGFCLHVLSPILCPWVLYLTLRFLALRMLRIVEIKEYW